MRTPSRVRDFVRCQVIAKHSPTTAGLLRARRLQSILNTARRWSDGVEERIMLKTTRLIAGHSECRSLAAGCLTFKRPLHLLADEQRPRPPSFLDGAADANLWTQLRVRVYVQHQGNPLRVAADVDAQVAAGP